LQYLGQATIGHLDSEKPKGFWVDLFLLTDEFEPFIPDQNDDFKRAYSDIGDEQLLILSHEESYEVAFNATTNDEVFVNPEHREELKAFYVPFEKSVGTRDFRRLTAFLDAIRPIIMCKFDDERDFINRYCFRKMKWNRRDIERIYFNLGSRKIYFQLNPHERIE
jgi:hypothetical protein